MLDRSAAAAPASACAANNSAAVDNGDDDVVLDRIVLEAMENERDRSMILQFESQIEAFVKDDSRTRLIFPPMSSYHRLILHRIAQFYKVDHPSQLLPDGKRQILLVKQSFSRIPRVRICDMESAIGTNSSPSPNPVSNPAPPMRIMRRAPVEDKPEQMPSTSMTESEQSLQSREEAYAKARAKLFEFDQSSQGGDDSATSDPSYTESRGFEIEPHEHDLYRRNVGVYGRGPLNPPSMYNAGQPGLAPRLQPQWGYYRTGIPPAPQGSAVGPMFWQRSPMLPSNDNRAYMPFYDPAQSRQIFSPPTQPLFANASNIEFSGWSLDDQDKGAAKTDYSFCTSMLEIYDLPKDAKNYQVDMILDDLKQRNCSLKWIADGRVIAVFETASDALEALQQVMDPRYKLRPWSGAM